MKKLYWISLCAGLLLFTHLQAQINKPFVKEGILYCPDPKGTWAFRLYPGDILQGTYTMAGLDRTESVSNAVIAEPLTAVPHIKRIQEGTAFSWGPYQVERVDSFWRIQHFLHESIRLLGGFSNEKERGLRFSLEPGEKIFGTGERSLPMNRRGYRLPLHNNPWYGYGQNADALNYSMPLVISSRMYALFYDNPASGNIDIGKTHADELIFSSRSGPLCFYFIPGNNYATVLENYHRLTGTQPLPPRWAMGNFLSRFGYRNEAQVRSIAEGMQKDSMPFDAIIFDLFWFGDSIKNTLGNLDWVNRKAWPDPQKMIQDWRKKNIKTILITEPFVLETSTTYPSALPYLSVDSAGAPYKLQDFYFGKGGLIDIFRPDAADWFYSRYKKQMDIGVAGWWGDLGEPEKHPENLYHKLNVAGKSRLFAAHEVHNMYGHIWSQSLYDRFRKDFPQQRLFHLNRSGYAGTPRFASFPWSGDVSRSWDGLKAQIPLMLGMSMSGVPYIHSDAGGFAGGDGNGELYNRWLQFAVFTPIFRPHGTALGNIEPSVKDIPSEATLWPEPYKSIARKAIQERYRWLPYNYTLAYEQTKYGNPLMRPLFYLFPADSNAYRAHHQYAWGQQVMVVPVTDPGIRTLQYYIPDGKWTNTQTGITLHGPQWITDSTITADAIPVWIREGSVIPQSGFMKTTNDYQEADFTLTYYPSLKPSSSSWYEDNGEDPLAPGNGAYARTIIQVSPEKEKVKMEMIPEGKGYTGMSKQKLIRFQLAPGHEPVRLSVNGKTITPKKDNASGTIYYPIPYRYQKLTLTFNYKTAR